MGSVMGYIVTFVIAALIAFSVWRAARYDRWTEGAYWLFLAFVLWAVVTR